MSRNSSVLSSWRHCARWNTPHCLHQVKKETPPGNLQRGPRLSCFPFISKGRQAGKNCAPGKREDGPSSTESTDRHSASASQSALHRFNLQREGQAVKKPQESSKGEESNGTAKENGMENLFRSSGYPVSTLKLELAGSGFLEKGELQHYKVSLL